MLKATKEEIEILKAAQLVLTVLGKDELNPHRGAYSVHQLARNALEETIKGNGEKKVFITSDDEGNSYHGLFYLLDTSSDDIEYLKSENSCMQDFKNDKIALLG